METKFALLFSAVCVIVIIVLVVTLRSPQIHEKFMHAMGSPYSYGTVIITDEETGDFGPKKTIFGDAASGDTPKVPTLDLETPTRCGYTKFETDNTHGSGAPKLNATDKYFARWIQGRPSGDEPNPYICGVKPVFGCVPYTVEAPKLVTPAHNSQVNLG